MKGRKGTMLAVIPFDVPFDDENNIEELPEEEYL